ncbi:MAG: hypothetical protein ACO1RT_06420 [Planctomycetaceae bacterium]
MRCALLVIALASVCSSAGADEWSPGKDPDLQAILQEARIDTQAQRYETALAKHVWLHEHALSVDPAFYGVRLSFALAYWRELADQYPPALAKLKEIRDAARRDVMAGKDVTQSFHDMRSINDYLGEHKATKEVFEALAEKDEKTARRVFGLAQPSLIKAKSYALIAKYISPKDDFAKLRNRYQHDKQLAEDPRFGAQHLEYAHKSFANASTTLVAILAVNDRMAEAEEIAALARSEWSDESFHRGLDDALKGVVPVPWP